MLSLFSVQDLQETQVRALGLYVRHMLVLESVGPRFTCVVAPCRRHSRNSHDPLIRNTPLMGERRI